MIYEYPDIDAPIRQGDIFVGVPCIDVPTYEMPLVTEDEEVTAASWEAVTQLGKEVAAIVGIRPVPAIVGTQNCDALRERDITLFEILHFEEVEGQSKNVTSPKSLMKIITRQCRINLKWFYLPPDQRIGFTQAMGVDFRAAFRVPRVTLEGLRAWRKGHLNSVAEEHFRERLSDFFRRYAYDEWYPLTPDQFEAYQQLHKDSPVKPFPWQEG